ncbi:hypothetical protein HPB50_005179 [Hyalomma asiaticum]|uniref:Uncharacterized protein n=1 Tax=Hyalomma asiaticum TaxID=266040 RepID=A0ACB7RT72_HYAAI|nr:hypothetical protein HPB50_005179 [Hyalomma asiaticum]
MNRAIIIAPKATLPSSPRQSTRQNGQHAERRQHRDSAEEAMQVRQRLMKVARRLGLVFGVRSRSSAEETLVMRSSLRKSPSSVAGARSSNKTKKTVRFEDTATVFSCAVGPVTNGSRMAVLRHPKSLAGGSPTVSATIKGRSLRALLSDGGRQPFVFEADVHMAMVSVNTYYREEATVGRKSILHE